MKAGHGRSQLQILSNFCQRGLLDEALKIMEAMDQRETSIPRSTVYCILRECSKRKDVAAGRRIQSYMARNRLDLVAGLSDHLIRLFAAYGSLLEANELFYKVANPSVYTWSAIISANANHGQPEKALELYKEMQLSGSIKSDRYIYAAVLRACTITSDLEEGRHIHKDIIKSKLEANIIIANILIDMYAKGGDLQEARQIFDTLLDKDAISWGSMLAGYAQHEQGLPALELFEEMRQNGIKPDMFAFSSILKACAGIRALEQGRLVHAQILQSGLFANPFVRSALVDMYAKCQDLEEAYEVFDKLPNRDNVAWDAMITGYAQHGYALCALQLYERMQQEGLKPEKVTFLSILKACGCLRALDQGRQIHGQVIKSELESDILISNTLIDMYCKCGSLQDARKVFDNLPNRNAVAYAALIAGYARCGINISSLELFEEMEKKGIRPEKATTLSILKACGNSGAIDQGRQIHDHIIQCGLDSDILVASTLVDMYAKCGSIEEACKVFDKIVIKDVVLWGAMIAAYARSGDVIRAGQCLGRMQLEGIRPNDVMFTVLLLACNHRGLVDEGCQYFKSMGEDHGLTPDVLHYNCLVDLLGRSGRLNEAEDLLWTSHAGKNGWKCLLTACKRYRNLQLGIRCFEQLLQIDSGDLQYLSELVPMEEQRSSADEIVVPITGAQIRNSGEVGIEFIRQ